jgi:hypothetical protein
MCARASPNALSDTFHILHDDCGNAICECIIQFVSSWYRSCMRLLKCLSRLAANISTLEFMSLQYLS